MWSLLFVWLGIIGLAVVPFSLGVVFEQKMESANREVGSRLLHRY